MTAEACTITGTDAAGPCPTITTACPAGCVPFEGKEFDRTAECLLPGTQLGCYPEGDMVTRNGACVQEIATDNVYFLESGSYANQLQIEGSYRACGLDDVAATSGVTDCP
jgi:hypothetical protein